MRSPASDRPAPGRSMTARGRGVGRGTSRVVLGRRPWYLGAIGKTEWSAEGHALELEALNGGRYALFSVLLLDTHDAREAVHLQRSPREALKIERERHGGAGFERHVGYEVDAVRTDVARDCAAALQPHRERGLESLFLSAGHGVDGYVVSTHAQ